MLRNRPRTARETNKKKKDITAGSVIAEFSDKDAEIERLNSKLAIYKHQATLLEDLQAQNESLQTQLEAA